MKEIQAFIRPEKLNKVFGVLRKEGFSSLTVFQGEGAGEYTDPQKDWPSLEFPYLHSRVIKLEMVCKDENVEKVCEIFQQQGRTGSRGDGLVYISAIEDVIRIRDGAKGIEILHDQKKMEQ